MLAYLRKVIPLIVSISLVYSTSINAQTNNDNSDNIIQESVNDFVTVGALGGVGFVLGLSTLSFVDEPTDHLKNLWVGFAIGMIAGVGVVAWKQANKSQQDIYQQGLNQRFFDTKKRIAWHNEVINELRSDTSTQDEPLQLQYQFKF